MNSRKICFITCVNDEVQFADIRDYIYALHVPEGYEIEILPVTGAESMTAGYNFAMKQSDAKYKVYILEQVYLIHKDFINHCIQLFEKHPKLGMLGVLGSDVFPLQGQWEVRNPAYGKKYDNRTGKMELISFQEVLNDYRPVQLLDDCILVTQDDISWEADGFSTSHDFGLSQSRRFMQNEYQVGVVHQERPWIIHDEQYNRNAVAAKEDDRNAFLKKYGQELLPLVSIMIPTYNRPEYFQLALESALNQTYPHIEIVIGDDSTDDRTEKLIQPYLQKHGNIRYVRNETNLGQFKNDLQLMEMSAGKYVNFLMDDDLFHPEKIEKMMHYMMNDLDHQISLVTSRRRIIDRNGAEVESESLSPEVFNQDTMTDGRELADIILKNNWNILGEPTTVLFRKNDLEESFGVFCGREYGCNVDLASWLNLLSVGHAVYITERLSSFRIHDGQQLSSDKMRLLGAADYAHEILHARERGFLQQEEDFQQAAGNCVRYSDIVMQNLSHEKKDSVQYQELSLFKERLKKLNIPVEVVLHVDLHKTGTTSIQETLHQEQNNKELRKNGILYPQCWSVNHSVPVFSTFCNEPENYHMNIKNKYTAADIQELNRKYKESLEVSISEINHSKLVISGEDISLLTDDNLRNAREYLESVYHNQVKIKVVIYVRNPVAWSSIFVQEQIKHNATLDDAVHDTYDLVIDLFRDRIEKFMAVFGRQSVEIFSFEEAVAHKYGIVGHFLSVLGFSPKAISKFNIRTSNESVSLNATDILSYINDKKPLLKNRNLQKERFSGDVHPLFSIVGPKFTLPNNTIEKITRLSREDTQWLKEQADIDYLTIKQDHSQSTVDITFTEETVQGIKNAYTQLSETLKRLLKEYVREKANSDIDQRSKDLLIKLLEELNAHQHYELKQYPLVSILIRSYNQINFLKEALESAISQTYPNIEIIIGDDSTNDKVKEFVKPYLREYDYIFYYKNKKERPDNGYQNHVNCYKQSRGEYINFLNHDDILHPQKIERMMGQFMQHPNLSLVTSFRQPIDGAGNKLPLKGAFLKIFEKDTMLKGQKLSQLVVSNLLNFIGEPSAVLFKKRYIDVQELNYFNGIRYKNIGDVANWFTLLQYGDGVYMSDALSYFRLHSDQNSQKPEIHLNGVVFWYQLIHDSYEKGIIEDKSNYRTIIMNWLTTFIPVMESLDRYKNVRSELLKKLSDTYKDAIDQIISTE